MTTIFVTLLATALGILPLREPHFPKANLDDGCVMYRLFRYTRLSGRCDTPEVAVHWRCESDV
jgi:hypothetical protein